MAAQPALEILKACGAELFCDLVLAPLCPRCSDAEMARRWPDTWWALWQHAVAMERFRPLEIVRANGQAPALEDLRRLREQREANQREYARLCGLVARAIGDVEWDEDRKTYKRAP